MIRLSACRFLADENIPPETVLALSDVVQIEQVLGSPLRSASDTTILETATRQGLVLITQDNDFGKLIFAERRPFFGVIHLRPGHLFPEVPTQLLRFVFASNLEVEPPFLNRRSACRGRHSSSFAKCASHRR